MTHSDLRLSELLDQASALSVRVAAPWAGVLWLGLLPLRLLEARFVAELISLGPAAERHGTHLGDLALGLALALVPAAWARAVYARACALDGPRATGTALRLPAAGVVEYLYVSLLLYLLLALTAVTLVSAPLIALAGGLAAVTIQPGARPGLIAPFARIARCGTHLPVLGAMVLILAGVLLAAFVNGFAAFSVGLWLLGAVPGFDPAPWVQVVSLRNPRFVLLLVSGARLVVEPFWLALLAVYVRSLRARSTGEDLRDWFSDLRRREAA